MGAIIVTISRSQMLLMKYIISKQYLYTHTHTHTQTHTHTHTHPHAHTRTHMQSLTYTCIHTNKHTHLMLPFIIYAGVAGYAVTLNTSESKSFPREVKGVFTCLYIYMNIHVCIVVYVS